MPLSRSKDTYFVYILQSRASGTFYCGLTTNLDDRPAPPEEDDAEDEENPWELIWHRECATRPDAMRLERNIKHRGIEQYLSDRNML